MPDVTDKKTIRNAAMIFIKKYGNEAPVQAMQRSIELDLAGESASKAHWALICQEIELLLSHQPKFLN